MNSSYFYKDKPLFGLDLGYSSMKVMQLTQDGKHFDVTGYGVINYDSAAIKNGVIVDHELLAKVSHELFDKHIVGEINTRRVAISIPAARAYTRTINLPTMSDDEIEGAVRLEAEQYIPVPVDDLYMDYEVINRSNDDIEILSVAVPKKVVDSYLKLVHILGLEPVAFETSILSAGRLFQYQAEYNDVSAILIDFGSESADITYHEKSVVVTGTIPHGGDKFTELIAKKLNVSREEAHVIKTKYGVSPSKKQAEILEVLKPSMDELAKEIRRLIRYQEERSGSKQSIGQVITMGGGANMPGLSEYLTNIMRLPVRMCDPWQKFNLHKLQPPSSTEKSIYVTVSGLSLMKPKELF